MRRMDHTADERLRHIGALDTIANLIYVGESYYWSESASGTVAARRTYELGVSDERFERIDHDLGPLVLAPMQRPKGDSAESMICTLRALAMVIRAGGAVDIREPASRTRKGPDRRPRRISCVVYDSATFDTFRWRLETDPRLRAPRGRD